LQQIWLVQSLVCPHFWLQVVEQMPLQQTWYPGAATWQSAVVVQFMAHEPPFWQTPCAASSGSLTGQQT
jgi:hypothetical protein